MLNTKPILKFVLVFFLAYGVFIAIAPIFRDQTGKYLASLGNNFLSSPVKNAFVSFYRNNEKFDIEIRVGNIKQAVNGTVQRYHEKLSSYDFLYMPVALLAALILASPVSTRRKIFSFLISLFFVHLMTLSRMYIQILHIGTSHLSMDLISSSESTQRFINLMHAYFVSYGAVKLFVVIFIWLAVTFRKEDLALIRSDSGS